MHRMYGFAYVFTSLPHPTAPNLALPDSAIKSDPLSMQAGWGEHCAQLAAYFSGEAIGLCSSKLARSSAIAQLY